MSSWVWRKSSSRARKTPGKIPLEPAVGVAAFREEMVIAAHALGKTNLTDLNTTDVYTSDPLLQALLHR